MAIQVSLDTMTVRYQDTTIPIAMAPAPRQMLVTGTWDTCSQLVGQGEQVKATAANLPYLGWSPVATAAQT